MMRPLFNSSEIKVHACDIECNEDIDVKVSLGIVMEENLIIVAELSKTINLNMMTSIKELAKRKT